MSIDRDRTSDSDGSRPRARSVVIAPGVRVPYPCASSAEASKIGRANRSRETQAEVALRSALHRRGLRYRKHLLIRTATTRVRPDVVFTRVKVAVFVDGCFWHMCPDHCHVPKSNVEYWGPKLRANVERDRRVDAALADDGWQAVHVWEHEAPSAASARVAEAVRPPGRTSTRVRR